MSFGDVIASIHGRSRTPDGMRILRHLGEAEAPSSTTSHNFMIDINASGLPMIEEYPATLASWQRQHASSPILRWP